MSAGRARGGEGAGPGPTPHRPPARFFRSEYNAFWKCVQAGVTYLFVQLCKVRDSGTPRVWPPGIPDFRDPALLFVALHGTTLETTLRDCARIPYKGWKPRGVLDVTFS